MKADPYLLKRAIEILDGVTNNQRDLRATVSIDNKPGQDSVNPICSPVLACGVMSSFGSSTITGSSIHRDLDGTNRLCVDSSGFKKPHSEQEIRMMDFAGIDSGTAAGSVPIGKKFFCIGVHIVNTGVAGQWFMILNEGQILGYLPANAFATITGQGILGTRGAQQGVQIYHDFGAGKAFGTVWGWQEAVL